MHSVNIFEIFWQVLFDERAGMLHRFPHWFWWHLCVVPHLAWRESVLADSTNREEHRHIHQLGALRKTGRHFPGRPCGRLPENWTSARIYLYYSLRCVCVCLYFSGFSCLSVDLSKCYKQNKYMLKVLKHYYRYMYTCVYWYMYLDIWSSNFHVEWPNYFIISR